MDRKRDFISYLRDKNFQEGEYLESTANHQSLTFYRQSSIIFRHILTIQSLIDERDMWFNFKKYGHSSLLEGLRYRQLQIDRIDIQTIVSDTNKVAQATKLIHNWLDNSNNTDSLCSSTNDEDMCKKGAISCILHVLQIVSDKIKSQETTKLETKSKASIFLTEIFGPHSLSNYDIFIPSSQEPSPSPIINKESGIVSKNLSISKEKDKRPPAQSPKSNVQVQESDLLIEQNQHLVETFTDISQDLSIVEAVHERLNEISTIFTQFSTKLNDQLDMFEDIRDNVQQSLGNLETTGKNLNKSLGKDFSFSVFSAYMFIICSVIILLLDIRRW